MKTKILKTVIILFWISWGPINWAATLGDFGYDSPPVRKHYGKAAYFGFFGIAAGPIAGFTVAIGTNFYEHGLVWK